MSFKNGGNYDTTIEQIATRIFNIVTNKDYTQTFYLLKQFKKIA